MHARSFQINKIMWLKLYIGEIDRNLVNNFTTSTDLVDILVIS